MKKILLFSIGIAAFGDVAAMSQVARPKQVVYPETTIVYKIGNKLYQASMTELQLAMNIDNKKDDEYIDTEVQKVTSNDPKYSELKKKETTCMNIV
ncbi:MAG: hypothetical protein LBT67_02730 [Holosporaceae bacterium]|nr:hypothetical protein [Holosporaceae bacterium]